MTYTVEVHYTDRSRHPDGRFVEHRTRVDVLADTPADAELVAAQMVAAIRDDQLDGMVTSTAILV